jgi:hypothetical protein
MDKNTQKQPRITRIYLIIKTPRVSQISLFLISVLISRIRGVLIFEAVSHAPHGAPGDA